jgi:cyclomaltodextrinase
VEFHKDWNDKPWRPHSGDGSDDQYSNDFFGGDIAGIIEKLDYIKSVGANTLYITPMFTAASNHKYDTADWKHIDPHFGSNADFARLCREAAKRGIRVLPDASLNHSGADSIYFDRYGTRGGQGAFEGGKINPASPYASWYTFDPTQAEPDKQFKGWVGVADLPELNKADPSYRAFAYGAPDSVTRTWLNAGASGWRMDVAPWVPDDFWREWRSVVKQTKPDALTVAETWFDASKFFLGDEFDSTMNYIFRDAVLDYANGGDAQLMVANLEEMREAYPPQTFSALMNLLSTHDTARSLHMFGDVDGKATPEQVALAKQKLRLAVFFQMTYPGSPAIFYGDEVGVTGGPDPMNRGTYPWADRGGHPDNALLADFRRLTSGCAATCRCCATARCSRRCTPTRTSWCSARDAATAHAWAPAVQDASLTGPRPGGARMNRADGAGRFSTPALAPWPMSRPRGTGRCSRPCSRARRSRRSRRTRRLVCVAQTDTRMPADRGHVIRRRWY